MNENEGEDDVFMGICAPPESTEAAASACSTLLPEKSKSQYERAYKLFQDWREANQTNSLSENVLLTYFQDLSHRMKPSSLWAVYSMLRMTLKIKNNIDIGNYPKLCAFLKSKSDGYEPKKSKTLTPQQINEFLSTAPDTEYLFTKVGLIFGIMGGCRREELLKIETNHIEDLNTALLVHIPDTKTKTERQFAIGGTFYHICKKYMEIRPPNLPTNRFFLNYQRGHCTKQPIGINKFGSLASVVAKFLKLPDPASYTGHCLRSSSAAILVDSGVNITPVKRDGGWRSTTVAEEENSAETSTFPFAVPKLEFFEDESFCKLDIEEDDIAATSAVPSITPKLEPISDEDESMASTSRAKSPNPAPRRKRKRKTNANVLVLREMRKTREVQQETNMLLKELVKGLLEFKDEFFKHKKRELDLIEENLSETKRRKLA